MADPYNPYSFYSTPTPGGIGYYPPDDQSHHREYGYEPQPHWSPDSNPGQVPHQSHNNLAPEPYGSTLERSYTPAGQPDYQGPVGPIGYHHSQTKVPENASYYNDDPVDQPRYAPTAPPPAVYISEAEDSQREQRSDNEDTDRDLDRGLGGSLAGGVAGYYLGHKKEHGLLGAIGGALLGHFIEDKVKDHAKNEDDDDDHRSEHSHREHHKHHHHRHRSHSRHSGHSHSGHSHSGHSHGSRHSSYSRHRGEEDEH